VSSDSDETNTNSSSSSREELLVEIGLLKNDLGLANQKLVDGASMTVVGQLAAAVGHEVNNPLQVLRSCLEYLDEDQPQAPSSEIAEVVNDAKLALSQIESVAELVPFARPVRDTTSILDLNGAVEHSLRIAHNELRHRTEVIVALGEIPRIKGVSAHLIKLLTGLFVSIARQLREDCEGNVLTISTDHDAHYVYVRLHCHLQQTASFFQELSERLRNSDSVHAVLGQKWITILMCQQIAISHGGTLAVDEQGEDSAQLSLRLPISDSLRVLPAEDVPRVLVIDDDKLVLRGLQRMLSHPYSVDSAANGKEALEKIRTTHYDVIVCDIMMPGLSGVGVYEQLEAIQSEARNRIIFISAGPFTEKSHDFAEATSQPVLTKPISRDDLVRALEDLLSKK